MSSVRGWIARFSSLFNRNKADREMEQEFQSHLQMQIEDNLRSGMSAGRSATRGIAQVRQHCRRAGGPSRPARPAVYGYTDPGFAIRSSASCAKAVVLLLSRCSRWRSALEPTLPSFPWSTRCCWRSCRQKSRTVWCSCGRRNLRQGSFLLPAPIIWIGKNRTTLWKVQLSTATLRPRMEVTMVFRNQF